ncbi:MAG: hypothetical protein ACXVAY_16990 [Mucilaginibacter sp.]
MKKILSIIKTLLPVIFAVITLHANAQATSDICNSMGDNASVSLKDASGGPLTAIKTGLDFNLILTLPGGLCQGGTYEVTVTTSDNLELGNPNPNAPFYSTGANQFSNSLVISANSGLGINVPFKFRPGTTCNNEHGTFDVTVKLICGGAVYKTCVFKTIGLTAIAQSYWTVTKTHVWGNLRGGTILWKVVITNTNPTPGIGDLNIFSGSIQDVFTTGNIVSVSGANATINTGTATWGTGTIYSTTPYVEYNVITTSCEPAGTVVKNCVNYDFCLGKKVSIIHIPDGEEKSKTEKKLIPPGGGVGPVLACLACSQISGQACATVTLVGTATTSANFAKVLTYPVSAHTINYAQGCQAEYTIVVSNSGNIPLNNLTITDNPFPSGIIVTQVSISSTGASLDYTTSLQTGTFNTANNQVFTAPSFANFNLTTTNGSLMGETIIIKIRFTITAATGTTISNCATLNYAGTYSGTGSTTTICGTPLSNPPAAAAITSCAQFTVQAPTSIPGISKCIRNGQQSFSIGDVISFRIVISNHGAAGFSGSLADLLGTTSLQNLSLVPGSVTYSYGTGPFTPYTVTPGCVADFANRSTSVPWVSATQQSTQSEVWNISNMPGDCAVDETSYLIIDFDAKVLPQSFGNYTNTAKLTTQTGTLEAPAYYNIMRTAQISTTKNVSSTYVEPGQPLNYIIDVKNEGSVALKNVKVDDVLPACVTYASARANILDVNGAVLSTATVTGGPSAFTLPASLVLQAGQTVELIIAVTRKADDKGDCCNPQARGSANTNDASSDNISDVDGPVCVKSSLCCNIKDLDVSFSTNYINGGIVPAFLITSGSPVPVQEIEVSLLDYHTEYNNANCKPANMGNLYGHIQPFDGYVSGNYYNYNNIPFTGSPSLSLQTVINPVNNSLLWSGSNPISLYSGSSWNFNGLIAVNFIAPDVVPLDCCSGRVYYCFKVRVKDANCNVCEKIVCGYADIPKATDSRPYVNDRAKSQMKLRALKGSAIQGKAGAAPNAREAFKTKSDQPKK